MKSVSIAAAVAGGAICALLASSTTGSANAATAGLPPLTILTHGANIGNGDIFVAPNGGPPGPGGSGYASGPEILSGTGQVIWSHPLPAGEFAADFRTQTYLGQPVLTWFQAGGAGGPMDVIYNDHFQQIATVQAGNGYRTDMHEFLITPWNTALILADDVTTADLTSIGGPSNQTVVDGVVQEVDISTGKVLFQWNSADHVPYSDSHVPLPPSASQPWDWFHVNAVHLDTDGNLLISSRHTWTVYKVNRVTGAMIWELGGKHSSFTLKGAPFTQGLDAAGEIFAWQHDPESLGNGVYTIFDDESDGNVTLFPTSRAVTVQLDLNTHVATLIKSINQPEGLVAAATGNAQTLPAGDMFVSWGNLPYISEFSPSGKLLFDAKWPNGVSSYRSYLLPWNPAS
ncbi:MAG TPA: arylsulfotransferase family protein [Streptosporangiaceae bacterium]